MAIARAKAESLAMQRHDGKMAACLGVSSLSMGMSGDYEKAVALGATHIRVGSALFGARG